MKTKYMSFKRSAVCLAVLSVMCGGVSVYAAEVTNTVETGNSAEVKNDSEAENAQENIAQLTRITVTGQRASNKRAIAAKRSQQRITDGISADDTKQLPDSTVAETIRRIPGISVTFNNDNVHGRDEAERPVIRGLDAKYNNITVDGLSIASADSNTIRGARMDLLPSSMIDRLDIYKSWSPDVDANAIGGSVDVLTRSAFANGGKTQVNGSAALGYVTEHGEPDTDSRYPVKGDIAASTTWGDDDLKFGASVAAYYSKVDSSTQGHATTDSTYYNWYNNSGVQVSNPSDSNGYPVPQNSKWFYFNNSREKQGATLKLEAKTESLYGFVTGGIFKSNMEETRNENFININPTGKVSPTNQTATSGHFSAAEAEVGIMNTPDDSRTTKVLQTGINWDIYEKNQVSFRYGWSEAERNQHYYMAKYSNDAYARANNSTATRATNDLALSYDTSGFEPVFTLDNPSVWTDMSNWKFHYYRDDEEKLKNTTNDARLDWKYNLNTDDRGFGFGAGFNHRENEVSYDRNRWDYQAAQDGLTAIGVVSDSGLALQSGGGLNLLTIDLDSVYNQLAANPDYLQRVASSDLQNTLQSDYNFKEIIDAGYAMAAYRGDSFNLNFGVRYDSAQNESSAYAKYTQDSLVSWEQVSEDSKYHYWLPSLSAQFKVTPDFLIRTAVTKTIGRPDYSSFVPTSSITENTDGTLAVVYGNPDIKPRESTNVDLSFEKYFDNGLLALGLFNKDIENEIYSAIVTDIPFTFNGQTYTADVTRDENSSGAKVAGAEVNLIVNSLDFIHPLLSRFGFSANYTYMKGSLDITKSDTTTRTIDHLLGQPDYIFNTSIFYSGPKLNARIAYNHIGESLRAIDTNNSFQDVFWKARYQLDASASYQINKNFAVFLEGKNLTEEKVTSVTGPNRDLLKDTYVVGASGWLGMRFKF